MFYTDLCAMKTRWSRKNFGVLLQCDVLRGGDGPPRREKIHLMCEMLLLGLRTAQPDFCAFAVFCGSHSRDMCAVAEIRKRFADT